MCVCGVGLVFAPLVMITVKWLSSKINKGGSTDEQREMLSCHTPFRNYYQVRLDVAIEEWNISVWESAFDHNRSFWMSMNTFQYNCIHSVWVYFCPFNTTNKGIWNQHPLLISIDSPYLWQSPFVCKKKKRQQKKNQMNISTTQSTTLFSTSIPWNAEEYADDFSAPNQWTCTRINILEIDMRYSATATKRKKEKRKKKKQHANGSRLYCRGDN